MFKTRFMWNRHWTLILALCAGLISVAAMDRTASADPYAESTGDYSDPAGGGGYGSGDPDVPTGSGKTPKPGRLSRGNMSLTVRAVGDGNVPTAWMWRLKIVLRTFRGYYFRF